MKNNSNNKVINIPNENIALSVYNLTKKFKNKIALNKINLEVKKGQFHGLIGSNGAGKTTIIRSILGFYPDIDGEIYIGQIKNTNSKSKLKLGYIPELAEFPKILTTYEYLYHFALISGLNKNEAESKIKLFIDKYEITDDICKKSPTKLSSGQKKKIMLIQALINDPDILILDEPAANLDPSARLELFNVLNEFHSQGKTIIISSHILAELENYIDSFTVIEHGEIIESNTIKSRRENSKYNSIIEVNNDKINDFLAVISELNIDNKIYDNKFLVKIDTIELKNKLFIKSIEKNIQIVSFNEYKESLKEIYFDKINK